MRSAKMAAMGLALATGIGGALWLTPTDAAPGTGKDEAAVAANAFLKSLRGDLRKKAQFALDSTERFDWNFVPKARNGASLLELDDGQAELLGPLLATALSPEGLLSARGIIKHENILRRIETERGVDATRRDPGHYYTSIFGSPGAAPWAWRFEGHHLSLNVTQVPGRPPLIGPVFMGANPATVPSGQQAGFRLLAAEEDLARALITMLPAERRQVAMIRDTAFSEIVTGNDREVKLEVAGLAAGEMSAEERQQLRELIGLYVGRFTAATASEVLQRLDGAGFDKLRFAWAGGIEAGQPHYYRVHGPTLLIEYDDTQNGANHIHTVYRDLQHDFGGDVLRAHYRGAAPGAAPDRPRQ
jgi:hypothetical protein